MTNQHDTARLSDYLDGELGPVAREELEAHLAGCPECARTLAELRAVAEEAGQLPDLPPERDLWPEIEARLTPRSGAAGADVVPIRRARRVVMTVPQLIAAGVALILFSASGVWMALGGTGGPGSDPMRAGAASAAVTTAAFTDFDATIATLEEEYRSRRDELDPATIRVVERNLAIIDQAIAEAREALAEDPSSGFLSTHLVNAMRQKMELLRQASMIAQTET